MLSTNARFGLLLRESREKVGLTQVELADLSTVSVRAIRNLELGLAKNPRRDTVRLLADALRLNGERRAALQLAAGHDGDDSAFAPALRFSPITAQTVYGREREIAALCALVKSGTGRVVRVTGMGGVGKTCLSRAVAEQLFAELGMHAVWVPLDTGEATRAPWIESLLAEGEPTPREICRLIGDRSVLLVLDGNDAGQVSDETLAVLLRSCPNVRIIVTSRTPSEPSADYHFPLNPLSVHDGQSAQAHPAVQLIVSRVNPCFTLTEGNAPTLLRICQLLDGIPRALESAARWFLLSSPADLVEIARHEPLMLTEPPSEDEPTGWARDAILSATGSLTAAQLNLLDVVANWDAPWTLEQVAVRTGTGRLEAAKAVHAFLMRGLIRPTAAAGENPVQFTVLSLVHSVLSTTPLEAVRAS